MGCGRLNSHGYHIRSVWAEGADHSLCTFSPEPWHTALPGYVYGGLLASVIDCHATGTAAAFAHRERGDAPYPRFVTASLTVDFLKPTPLAPFRVEGRVLTHEGRRIILECTVVSGGDITVRGQVSVAQITRMDWPTRLAPESASSGTP